MSDLTHAHIQQYTTINCNRYVLPQFLFTYVFDCSPWEFITFLPNNTHITWRKLCRKKSYLINLGVSFLSFTYSEVKAIFWQQLSFFPNTIYYARFSVLIPNMNRAWAKILTDIRISIFMGKWLWIYGIGRYVSWIRLYIFSFVACIFNPMEDVAPL